LLAWIIALFSIKKCGSQERLNSGFAKLLSLTVMDAKAFLQQLSTEQFPDVIYIDPMHPVSEIPSYF
jgi:hypothetical protein